MSGFRVQDMGPGGSSVRASDGRPRLTISCW